jgi:hypothetical protein
MEHNRDLVLGVIFRDKCEATLKMLEFEMDDSQKTQGKSKEIITLDACL